MSHHYSINDLRAAFSALDRMYLSKEKDVFFFNRNGDVMMFQGEHPDPDMTSSLINYLMSEGRIFRNDDEAYQRVFLKK
jgi:hypothetical protein